MIVIADSNIFYSSLITPNGTIAAILKDRNMQFLAPDYIIEEVKELITYQEYALALENLLKNLLGKCISIPRDTLAIIDVVEDPHIRRLQASLWGI